MAGMKFEYDENGGKFYYFLLSFYAMIVVPCTYYLWPKNEKKKDQSHPEDLSTFPPCRIKQQLMYANEPRKTKVNLLIKTVLIIAWIIFFILAYNVTKIEVEHKEYDPYSVLDVDRGATDKEIKKKYLLLSKTRHPDHGGDAEQFKELVKAYKSLTHNETKENWEKYGNPDGPGVTHFGIALPKWMVDDKNSIFVLGFYVVIFMIIMPVVVGLWWYKSIKYTSDKIFIITGRMYSEFFMKSTLILPKRALMILGASFEFYRYHNPEVIERPSDNIELPQLFKDLPNLQEKNRELPLCCPYSVKARALLHAHLTRLDLPPNSLLKDKYMILKKCPYLINEMVSLLAQIVSYTHAKEANQPKLETIENVMRLSPMIVQALWDTNKNSLLQLPNIDESHLRHFVTKKRSIWTIKQFVAAKDSERRSILRYLTDEQYDDIMRVCAIYPLIKMTVTSEVSDDEDGHTITVGAIVTLTIQLDRQNLKVLFDKETYDDKQVDEKENGENTSETNENLEKSTEEPKKVSKPWEKQKKKPKFAAKSKTKSKPVQKTAVKTVVTTKKTENSTNKVEELVQKTEKSNSDGEDNAEDQNDDSDKRSSEEELSEDEDQPLINKNSNDQPTPTSLSTKTSSKQEQGEGEDEFFEKFQQQQKKREKLETKAKISHRVFCPYFPDIKQECWWLYVGDRKHSQLISAPVYICTLKDSEEIEVKFTAPKKVGQYTYHVILRSDSYFDFDVSEQIKLDVKEAKKIEEHPQWDFGDEEGENDGTKQPDDDEYDTDTDEDE